MLLDEVLDEHRDVVAALAQRRDADRDHVEAVVQVLLEAAVGDHLLQVAVGGGDDADVHALRALGRRAARTRAPGCTRSSLAWMASASASRSRRGRSSRRRPARTCRAWSSTRR